MGISQRWVWVNTEIRKSGFQIEVCGGRTIYLRWEYVPLDSLFVDMHIKSSWTPPNDFLFPPFFVSIIFASYKRFCKTGNQIFWNGWSLHWLVQKFYSHFMTLFIDQQLIFSIVCFLILGVGTGQFWLPVSGYVHRCCNLYNVHIYVNLEHSAIQLR